MPVVRLREFPRAVSRASGRRRAQPEAELQRALITHIKVRRQPGWLIWAVPNAAKRSPRLGAELKRQGLVPGVGDLSLVHGGRYYELELKTERGRQSDAQRERAFAVHDAGGDYALAFGLDDALRILQSWGAIR